MSELKDIVQGRCVVYISERGIIIYENYEMFEQYGIDFDLNISTERRHNIYPNFIWLLQQLAKGDGSNNYKHKCIHDGSNEQRRDPSQFYNVYFYCGHASHRNLDKIHYDSNFLVLLDKGVYREWVQDLNESYRLYKAGEMTKDGWIKLWYSEASRLEYEWLKDHYVEIRSLQHPEIIL